MAESMRGLKRSHRCTEVTKADIGSTVTLMGWVPVSYTHLYHPSADLSMIEKAFHIANNAHKGQLRKSGEPYIIHPLCVAIILADLELDKETIVAGLLHDVVEDTVMTGEEIRNEFSLSLIHI